MFTKVFSTSNAYSIHCLWKKSPSGKMKPRHSGKTGQRLGICDGIVLAWLKKSIASNDEIQSAAELGSPHLMAIVSAASNKGTMYGIKGTQWFIRVSALLASQGLSAGAFEYVRINMTSTRAGAWMAEHEGYCTLVIEGQIGVLHILGGRYQQNGTCDLFDPNEGLFRSQNAESFIQDVTFYLQRKYARTPYARGLICQVTA